MEVGNQREWEASRRADLATCLEPFEDEVHPRLRYTHRGLLGAANNGKKNSNDSQFFVTLGKDLLSLNVKRKL